MSPTAGRSALSVKKTVVTAFIGSVFCIMGTPVVVAGARTETTYFMSPNQTGDLRSLLAQARERNRRYQAPHPAELHKVAAAVRGLLGGLIGRRASIAPFLFHHAHFNLTPTELGGAPAVAVREDPDYRRCGGIYVFRLGEVPRERIVQVPHSFFDVGTLEIGIELATVTQARALFVNTIHRYEGGKPPSADDDEPQASPADVAHNEQAFFHAFTLAALRALVRPQIIQVHGFADGGIADCPSAAVVISAGAAPAGAQEAAQVAARLGALLGGGRVLLFPRDTQRLGAQKNVQGRAASAAAGATFLHIEISRTLRDQLNRDSSLRRAFAAAVAGSQGEAL
jgi:hypothetical protein